MSLSDPDNTISFFNIQKQEVQKTQCYQVPGAIQENPADSSKRCGNLGYVRLITGDTEMSDTVLALKQSYSNWGRTG